MDQIPCRLDRLFFMNAGFRKLTKNLLAIMASWGAVVPSARSQLADGCSEVDLAFRVDIRVPDEVEMAWEATWPDAGDELQTWRAEGFRTLTQVWKVWAPLLPELEAHAEQASLPPSLAYVALWSGASNPFQAQVASGRDAHTFLDALSPEDSPEDFLAFAHRASESEWPFEAWAKAVRTGLRLMENFALPHVHVVQAGETVYSISRTYGIPPGCLSAKNGVWDDIQPGLPLLIPQLAP